MAASSHSLACQAMQAEFRNNHQLLAPMLTLAAVGSNAVRAFHILRAGETYEMVLRCTGASSSDAAAGGAAR